MANSNKGQYQAKPVIWNGSQFGSIEQMARYFGTSAQRLRYYIKNDKPFEGHIIDYEIR